VVERTNVEIGVKADTKNAKAAFARLGKSFEDSGAKMEKLGHGLKTIGSTLTAAITLPIVAVGAASLKMAADAVESESLFEVSYGNMAKQAREWSEKTGEALGRNAYELRKNSAVIFTMTENMGLSREAAFKMATGVSELTHDMASFRNIKGEEAFNKIRAGITGETEPLKQLGILVDEATIKQEAYSTGIAVTGTKLTQTQKVQARWSAILRQTTKDQGDVIRTQNSFVNSIRAMREKLAETSIELGQALLPLFEKLLPHLRGGVEWLGKLVESFKNLSPSMQTTIIVFTGLLAAIGPVIATAGLLTVALGSVMTAVGTLTTAMAGAGGLSGILATLAATVLPALGTALAVVGTAIAAYKLTKWTMEWTGLRKAVDRYYEILLRVKKELPPTSQQMTVMEKASRLAGREITDWSEAMKIVNKDLAEQRERMERYTKKLAENNKTTVVHVKSLREQAREMLSVKKETDKLKQATSLAGQEIRDMALAEAVLNESLRTIDRTIDPVYADMTKMPPVLDMTSYSTEALVKMLDVYAFNLKNKVEPAQKDFFEGAITMSDETLRSLGILGSGTDRFVSLWDNSLGQAADIIRIFEGSVAESIGRIIGYMAAAQKGGEDFAAGFRSGNWGQAIGGLVQGVSAVGAATATGGRATRTAGGALAGAKLGAGIGSVIPGIGTAIGAGVGALVGGLIGLFRGRRERKLMEKVGEDYGIWMTQAMAKSVTDKAKELKIADELAALLFTGEMFRAGMVSVKSFGMMFTDLMKGVKEGTIPAKEGLEAIDDAFKAMVESAGTMGDAGVFQIGRMVNEMREMGMMTQEVAQQVAQWVGEGISRLGDYFGYLAEQTEITGEQANAAVQLLAAGFAAAIEQTGSLYAAIMSLPEGFGALIERLGEMIGTENEAFLRMQELYDFVQDNEATLGAIAALGDALRAFGMAGILTAADVEALGTSMGAEFQRLIDSGADLTSIIAAVGPELAVLYRAYKELGMDVPPWLQGIAEDLKGMEPPRDTKDILGSIEDAIWLIAQALGAAVGEAEDLGTAIGNIPDTPGGRGGGGRGGNGEGNGFHEGRGGQFGAMVSPRSGGELWRLGGEGETELVAPVKAFIKQLATDMRQMGDGGTITVNLMLDRKVLAKEVVRSVNEGQRHGYIDPTGEGAETR